MYNFHAKNVIVSLQIAENSLCTIKLCNIQLDPFSDMDIGVFLRCVAAQGKGLQFFVFEDV